MHQVLSIVLLIWAAALLWVVPGVETLEVQLTGLALLYWAERLRHEHAQAVKRVTR